MKFLKILLYGVSGVLVVLLAVSLFLPSGWRVERSIEIKVVPAAIYPYINNLGKWREWTIWYERNPDMKVSYEGPSQGVGAVSRWEDRDGAGVTRITASERNRSINYELEFGDGEMPSQGVITLAPGSDGTRVTWTLEGDVGWDLAARYFALLLDDWIGRDFEEGLAKLRRLLEPARA